MIDEQSAPVGTAVIAIGAHNYLTFGNYYTVLSWRYGTDVQVVSDYGAWWFAPACFDLPPHTSVMAKANGAQPASRTPTPSSAPVGSWVESVYSQPPYLTVGWTYEVKRWSVTSQCLDVVDDTNTPRLFVATLFEIPQPLTPTGIGGAAAPLQGHTYASLARASAQALNISWDDVALPTPAKSSPATCPSCEIELCAELDAYYGKDAFLGKYCAKCRRFARHSPNIEEIP